MAGPGGKEVGRVSVRVLPDTSAFARSLERYLGRVERSVRVEIPTVVDDSNLRDDVSRVAATAARSAEIELPAEIDETGAQAKATGLAKRLSGKNIVYDVEIDQRGITGAINRVARLAMSLRTLAVPAGLLAATPAIAGLGAAAVQASGAIALLPAAAGAAAIGIGTLKLAFSGFGEAMENIGDPAKFAEALSTLAPAAQNVALQVKGLKPAFDALQLDMQQKFFAGLGDVVARLGQQYLPMLQAGLSRTASAMSDMARQAGEALLQPQAINSVNVLLDQTAVAFRNLAPAGAAVVSALTRIGEVGASFLPDMASAATRVAESFNSWVQAAAASGQLRDIIAQALTVLRQLGQIAVNVGSALGGIFAAANAQGAGILTTLERMTAGLAQFVHSAQGATALRQLFGGISAAMAGIMPALLSVVRALVVQLGPVIAQLGPAIGQLATQFGAVLVTAIRILSPLLLQLATFLRQNMTWLGPLVIGFGLFAAAIGPVIAIAGRLVAAFRMVVAVFRVLRVVLLTNPFVALAAAVIAIAYLIYSNWGAIKNFLLGVWRAIRGAAVAFGNAVASFFSGLWARVTGFFRSAGSSLVSITSGAWRTLTSVVSNGVSRVVGFVRGLPGMIVSALGDLGSLLWGAGADLVRGMINGVRSMIGNLLGTVRDMAASAVNTVKSWLGIGSPSKVFRDLGEWTGEGFAKGIERGTPAAVDAAAGMANSVASVPVSAPAAPSSSGSDSLSNAVTAGVLAALDGARMRIDGDGVARLVNRTNALNARR